MLQSITSRLLFPPRHGVHSFAHSGIEVLSVRLMGIRGDHA